METNSQQNSNSSAQTPQKNQQIQTERRKKLYIMRGLSGSGKSTLARELVGSTGVVLSSDDYFFKNGEYKWDGKKLRNAHEWNQKRAIDAFQKGITPIAIDNTNSKCWEAKFYVENGLSYGYDVEIKEPTTPWAKNPVELAKRNKHGVSVETIEKMLERWETDFTVDSILASHTTK